MNYSEKLRDPRWQKKRLEIMQRDEFKCRYCGDDKNTLNVHHLKYDGNPWETSVENLITVCQNCHNTDHDIRKDIEQDIMLKLRRAVSIRGVFDLGYIIDTLHPFNIQGNELVLEKLLWAIRHPNFIKTITPIAKEAEDEARLILNKELIRP